MHYHNNRFGQHPRFQYYLYNLMMHHNSQATTSVFVKKKIEDTLPTTVAELRLHIKNMPSSMLLDQIMQFISGLRGTHSFYNKCKTDLIDMITQIGSTTFFFTLSAANTKWYDFHMFMLCNCLTNSNDAYRWKIQNIVTNPHIASQYMYFRF